MAGADTPDIGAPHSSAPVRPPRRVLPPDPATAPDGGGWTTLASFRDPAQRHRRLERTLWLLVAAVAVAGVVIIGAILTSGPSSEAILPPGTGSRIGGSLGDGDTPSLVAGPGGTDDVPGSAGADGRHHDGAPDDHASPSPVDDDDAPPSDGDAPPDLGAPPGGGDAPPGDELPASDDGPPPGWSEVARGFGLAFTRTGVGHEAWFASLASWLTPEQAAEYRDVPIEAIPTGTLVRVDVGDPASEHVQGTLTYDTGMILAVGLSYRAGAGTWLVARIELADAAEAG